MPCIDRSIDRSRRLIVSVHKCAPLTADYLTHTHTHRNVLTALLGTSHTLVFISWGIKLVTIFIHWTGFSGASHASRDKPEQLQVVLQVSSSLRKISVPPGAGERARTSAGVCENTIRNIRSTNAALQLQLIKADHSELRFFMWKSFIRTFWDPFDFVRTCD